MFIFFALFLFLLELAHAQSPVNVCDILKIKNCEGVSRQSRRAGLLSAPSPSTSALMNPATVSFDRGFGVEAIYQAGNPLFVGAASGTGRMGGALMSTSLENTFFGNRVPELESDFLSRHKSKKQFKPDKLSVALGGRLIKSRHFLLDLGVILKRHNEIKDINPGVGVAGRLGFLTYSAATYKDDFFLRSRTLTDDYSESFTVTTFSVGTRYKNLAFDFGGIKSQYKYEDYQSDIKLYSLAYTYRNLMFNLAYRDERSFSPLFRNNELEPKEKKTAFFTGIQTSLGDYLILGVNYNYFLLKEISFSTSIFF